MKYYAVIHAVAGLFEGYSDTSCDWFPTEEAAQKHVKQMCDTYREDEMCVLIDHREEDIYVTLTRDHEDYHACVPSDMEHDDWVADNMDDVSVEVFRIVEVDASRYEGSGTTEHIWLTWDQLDACVAWDYNPLCMSLVARVSDDVMPRMQSCWSDHAKTQALHDMAQLGEFISDVYYRNHAFIDIDDYSMHAFRIPKKLEKKCDECGYVDDAVASHYEECSKLDTDA